MICSFRGSVKSREQRGQSHFLVVVLGLYGDVGGGVLVVLSLGWVVFVVSLMLFSFVFVGHEKASILEVLVLLVCFKYFGVKMSSGFSFDARLVTFREPDRSL